MKLKIESTKFVKVSNIQIPEIFFRRMKSGVEELDAVFGEGILPGSAFTITAAAGTGKTTFLLQVMEALANNGYEVGYASGEENQYQLAYTCKRLNVSSVCIANETDIDTLAEATKDLDILVIDSFQALTSEKQMNSAEQDRYAVTTLLQAAKKNECALFFVMHLTKDGKLKGNTLIPHAVDVNIQIMMDPEGDEQARIISTYKNRFGPCQDYQATMTSRGFEVSGKREVIATVSKASRRKSELKKVLEMKEPPGITKERIINELNVTSSQAYLILKELTDSKQLIKYGRGANAIFKHAAVPA
jgi:predicted ATP-dependent serine protease